MQYLRDLLFTEDAAVTHPPHPPTPHSTGDLQKLTNRFSKGCQDFKLTISLKETQVISQNMESPPNTTILEREVSDSHSTTSGRKKF